MSQDSNFRFNHPRLPDNLLVFDPSLGQSVTLHDYAFRAAVRAAEMRVSSANEMRRDENAEIIELKFKFLNSEK